MFEGIHQQADLPADKRSYAAKMPEILFIQDTISRALPSMKRGIPSPEARGTATEVMHMDCSINMFAPVDSTSKWVELRIRRTAQYFTFAFDAEDRKRRSGKSTVATHRVRIDKLEADPETHLKKLLEWVLEHHQTAKRHVLEAM